MDNFKIQMCEEAIAEHITEGCCTETEPCWSRAGAMQIISAERSTAVLIPATSSTDEDPFQHGTGSGTGSAYRSSARASEKALVYAKSLLRQWMSFELSENEPISNILLKTHDAYQAILNEGYAHNVSKMIDTLKSSLERMRRESPSKPASVRETLAPGLYRTPEREIYQVQKSRDSDRMYAKHLVQNCDEWSFEYEAGAIRKLASSMRMTLDEAKAWGHETGSCCVCSRRLTNSVSVALGIGPVCGGRV